MYAFITFGQSSTCNTDNMHRLESASTCTFKQSAIQFEKFYENFKTVAIPFEQKSCKPTQIYLNYVTGFFMY